MLGLLRVATSESKDLLPGSLGLEVLRFAQKKIKCIFSKKLSKD